MLPSLQDGNTARISYVILLLMLCPLSLFSQEKHQIVFEGAAWAEEASFPLPVNCRDSADLILKLRTSLSGLYNLGFLTARVDSIRKNKESFHVSLNPGPKFSWLQLDAGNLTAGMIESIGYNPAFFSGKPVNYQEISRLMNELVRYYANHGYPFAVVKIDSIHIDGARVSGKLNLEKNKIFRFDSINVISTEKIAVPYLEKLLQLQKGTAYDHSKVMDIETKIRSLPFVSLEENPIVHFQGNRVTIDLKLKPRNASRFDVLIGILPDNTTDRKLRITGDVETALYNKLGRGEFAGFKYKSQQNDRQELELNLDYPYLLNLPFGINSSFSLFRNKDLNRDLDLDLGLDYRLKREGTFRIFYNFESSRLLGIDTAKLLKEKRLPESLDIELKGIGLSFRFNKLNYLYNPRKGYALMVQGTAGQKTILPNEEIRSLMNEQVDFSQSYDTIRSGAQFSLRGEYDHFIPLGQVMTLRIANRSGIKLSENSLFLNESFRIGGSRLLRGFDEESLYATSYTVFSLEPRLLISQNSYFFVFGDLAWIRRNTVNSKFSDRLFGLGAGLSFDTGAGILLVSAAVGSQAGAPLDFGSSKIHVGYVGLF